MNNNKLFEPSNNDYFTKRKIITMILLSIVVITFIVLVSLFLLDIDFQRIYDLLEYSRRNNNQFYLWFFLMFLFPFYYCFWRIRIFSYKMKKLGLKAKWYDWFLFASIGSFLSAVSPFSVGDDPYTIFWLRKNGMSLRQATVSVTSVGVVGPFIQIIITWPSFFYLSSMYNLLSVNWEWMLLYWLTFMGLVFDIIGFILYLLISYSRRAHYFINIIFNKIRKLLRRSWKTKEQIRKEFIDNATFQKEFLSELKDLKFFIPFLIGSLLWNVIYYITMIFSYKLLNPEIEMNVFNLFNYVNVAVTANNFIPIPGGEGTLQILLSGFLKYGNDFSNSMRESDIKDVINSMVFIWRSFTFYLIALFGMMSFFIAAIIMVKRHKNKSKIKIIHI